MRAHPFARPLPRRRTASLSAAALAATIALAGCSVDAASGGADGSETVAVSAFSVMESANKQVFEDFTQTDAGKGLSVDDFTTSYGPSGDQSRAVEAGADADVVDYSLEPDVTRLVDAGLVDSDWKDTPTQGIATSSVVVFVVRQGNPLGIKTWDDLVKPGVDIITPNPGSSGSARWNILAAWAHITGDGGSQAEAKQFVGSLLKNTIALPASGRDATTAFTDGSGDVLLSYENEAILAKQSGADIDYVVPPDTLLIENPAAVTTSADDTARAFLDFMTSPQAQAEYAAAGFRPVVDGVDLPEVEGANDPSDPFPAPEHLWTMQKQFGGWSKASSEFFGSGEDGDPLGIVTEIQQQTGKLGES
ncbi:sulfate ABC transporter substrate-binding protein [Nocardioides acrostichi]|uniref:Sulfate ABC transporter substrate-binding protein n=1 Tax=Nocardioides acrostichi TaxID=2784339 RepID=A0A930V2G0_9ACTN|nr:sulfate ABC transporter substrate-binding protein [Nocardioides acrostichi]MBF4162510.1 sulfate ABC transporter substrate-binding protein [Nocardioides acrostichi]